MRFFLIITLCWTAAACGNKDEISEAAIVATSVTASDELGGFTNPITGAAFWTHPTVAFNSLMVITTDNMLASYDIEDGTRIDKVDNVSPSDVSISYNGVGRSARGIAAIFDKTSAEFRFYAIDNIDRSFVALPLQISAPEAINGFCLGRKSGASTLALHILKEGGLTSYDLILSNTGLNASSSINVEARSDLVDCVVDDLDGAVFAITQNGEVYRYADGETSDSPFAVTGASNISEIGLSLSGLVEGGPTDECCGQIAVLDNSNGYIHLFDRDDGHALGVAEVTASFDVEAVTSATTMGVGYGNFGATYRDGVLALATTGAPPVIRLAPWNSVLNALKQSAGEPANPRNLTPQKEDDALSLDLNVIEP